MKIKLDKQTESEYPTLRRTYVLKYLRRNVRYAVRKYFSPLRYLYVRLKYLTYVTLRLTLGTILFTVVVFSATARLVARTACHSYVRRQAGESNHEQ